jgi:NAD(P)-dependent dehydrogenase (short-subunit alcohol dehydrogenase family)
MEKLQGKTCLVTGASSGLGLATTELFAENGATVVMVCRNKDKAHTAVEGIRHRNPTASVSLELCDFSSLDSLRSFISTFTNNHTCLDILCNNAAAMKPVYTETGDGLEYMLQTNYLAPFILTQSFLHLLKRSQDPRVINITLPPEKLRLDLSDLQCRRSFNTMQSFYKTKLALLLHSLELADSLTGNDVSIICADPGPGPFDSGLVRDMPAPMRLFKKLISSKVDKAAANILFYATHSFLRKETIFKGTNPQQRIPYWNDRQVRDELRQKTDELLADLIS